MTTKHFITMAVLSLLTATAAQASLIEGIKSYYKKDKSQTVQKNNLIAVLENSEVTPNSVPNAKCVYSSESLEVPNSNYRISQFEIWTVNKGTVEKEPSISAHLRLRDQYRRDAGTWTFTVGIQELGWITDRLSQPKGITETTLRRDVDFEGVKYNIVFKRTVSDIKNPIVNAEMILYTQGEQPTAVLHARCATELPAKK